MSQLAASDFEEHVDKGERVEVRSRFDGRWTRGFVVEETLDDGRFRVRRVSDDYVLPSEFEPDDVRKERRRGLWWY